MTIAVVILAGGEGRRIGGGKPLRTLGGRSLIDRAIEQAQAMSGTVAIAVRNRSQIGDPGVQPLFDAPDIEGPLAGLAAALNFAATVDKVLTIPSDAPFLPDDLLARLEAALSPGTAAAVASSDGRLHPTCALWRTEAQAKLAGYLSSGRRSLHGFAEHVGHVAVDWPAEPVDPFFNINSEDNLVRAEQMLALR